uniref:DNA polymerase subunit gamma-2, mitochondrial n=1 Tax=Heliothis virescens TaxID=7102 RepID=A0A2A4JMW4_HELVI
MNIEINKLLQLKQFFTILQSQENRVKFKMREPSKLIIKNIHVDWLQYNHIKSDKHHMPIYLNDLKHKLEHNPSTFGIVKQELLDYRKDVTLELKSQSCDLVKKSLLALELTVPHQYGMQYLMQWQRYRKYWWSSISTTPSLFSTDEIKYDNNCANVDIVAQFSTGPSPVETLSFEGNINKNTCTLTCTMNLEHALFALLLDGMSNSNKEDYLRFHRKIAPYKISIALNIGRETINGGLVCKLASSLYQRLESSKISTWLPDFSLPLDMQVKEGLGMGVLYTAILDERALEYGLFDLMNSSTTLMEKVHVADFCKYASLISGKEVIV